METAVHVCDQLTDTAGLALHTALVNGNHCGRYDYRSYGYPLSGRCG